MKKTNFNRLMLVAILFCYATFAYAGWLEVSPNPFGTNASFETTGETLFSRATYLGTTNPNGITGFYFSNSTGVNTTTSGYDNTTAITGTQSFKSDMTNVSSNNVSLATDAFTVAVPGTYMFTFWVKGINTIRTPWIYVKYYDASLGSVTAGAGTAYPTGAGSASGGGITTSWTRRTLTYVTTLPNQIMSFKIEHGTANAANTVWFDDFRIYKLDNTVNNTDFYQNFNSGLPIDISSSNVGLASDNNALKGTMYDPNVIPNGNLGWGQSITQLMNNNIPNPSAASYSFKIKFETPTNLFTWNSGTSTKGTPADNTFKVMLRTYNATGGGNFVTGKEVTVTVDANSTNWVTYTGTIDLTANSSEPITSISFFLGTGSNKYWGNLWIDDVYLGAAAALPTGIQNASSTNTFVTVEGHNLKLHGDVTAVEVYDAMGKLILLQRNVTSVNVPVKGIYIVKLHAAQGVNTQKVSVN